MLLVLDRWTHGSSTSSVLGSTSGDVGDLVVLHELIVPDRGAINTETVNPRQICTHKGVCFSSARTASLALRSYFFRSSSPLKT